MNNKTTLNLVEIRPSPHIKGPRSVENIMRRVMYMCIILAICFVLQYGMSVLLFIIFVIGGSLLNVEALREVQEVGRCLLTCVAL